VGRVRRRGDWMCKRGRGWDFMTGAGKGRIGPISWRAERAGGRSGARRSRVEGNETAIVAEGSVSVGTRPQAQWQPSYSCSFMEGYGWGKGGGTTVVRVVRRSRRKLATAKPVQSRVREGEKVGTYESTPFISSRQGRGK
jgi:hypothetical protein